MSTLNVQVTQVVQEKKGKKYPTAPLTAAEVARVRASLTVGTEIRPRIRRAYKSTSKAGVVYALPTDVLRVLIRRGEDISAMTFDTIYKSFTWAGRPDLGGRGIFLSAERLEHVRFLRSFAFSEGHYLPAWPEVDDLGA